MAEVSRESFLAGDPLIFPRRFFVLGRATEEIEALALFSAMLAYGKVEVFMARIREVLEKCDERFLELLTGRRRLPVWPGYRLSTSDDIRDFALGIGGLITSRGSLRKAFEEGWQREMTIRAGLISLRAGLLQHISSRTRGLLHLLPDPQLGGCCKRWHMFLRWMVRRDDGIDLGLWPQIPPSRLLIPIDRHISRLARNLGLTARKTDNWLTVEEITANLRLLAPEDPVRYDFSLCHLAISGQCTHGKNPDICRECFMTTVCQKGNHG